MRIAPRVYTEQADIDRLQSLIPELSNDRRVEVRLVDGRVFSGIVAARPMTTQFFDADGQEGTNGVVRLEQPALDHPEDAHRVDLFLDQIESIRPLDRHELDPQPPGTN
jgi:hypothetical protein